MQMEHPSENGDDIAIYALRMYRHPTTFTAIHTRHDDGVVVEMEVNPQLPPVSLLNGRFLPRALGH